MKYKTLLTILHARMTFGSPPEIIQGFQVCLEIAAQFIILVATTRTTDPGTWHCKTSSHAHTKSFLADGIPPSPVNEELLPRERSGALIGIPDARRSPKRIAEVLVQGEAGAVYPRALSHLWRVHSRGQAEVSLVSNPLQYLSCQPSRLQPGQPSDSMTRSNQSVRKLPKSQLCSEIPCARRQPRD